jgi:formylglycine-generating enzyme required for sulfatase activity
MHTPEGHFILVSGSSGTGKSSLVDAGVLGRLEQAGLPGEKRGQSVRMVPSQGSHPFDALTRVLHPYAERAGLDPYNLGDDLAAQPATFTAQIQKIIAKGLDREALVLFVDQMEELFTARHQDKDRTRSEAFLSALYRGAHETPLWVIATLRSDFLHHCHNHPDMLKVLRGPGHYPLGRVEPVMMDEMIVNPAQGAGLSISDNLVRRLIRDAGSEPGHLPLLAFVLERLFEQRQGHTLGEDVYRALGGVEGAIADHIKKVEAQLTKKFGSKALDRLSRIFPLLLRVGAEGAPTRRRASWSEFAGDLRPIVEALVKRRLLSTEGEGDESTVSLAHEALIHSWTRLQSWLAEDREFLLWQQRLQASLDDWQRTRDKGLLLRGGPLIEAKRWRTERREKLTNPQKDFIQASQNRQIRARLGIGSAVVAVLVGVSFFLWVTDRNMNAHVGMGVLLAKLNLYILQPEMVKVSAGTFMMGSPAPTSPAADPDARENEFNQHKVEFDHPFRIGKYEVTFDEYEVFARLTNRTVPNDRGWGPGRYQPVIDVSWEDARAYAAWLAERTKRKYRLPTEAEWEYAARAGTEGRYWWCKKTEPNCDIETGRANCQGFGGEWDGKNRTAPVDAFEPNPWSLYNTAGNVWEWVQDCWHERYDDAPKEGSKPWLEENGGDCGRRVIRGGSWSDIPQDLRSAARSWGDPDSGFSYVGFRLAQDLN